jgi:hypothetical protein
MRWTGLKADFLDAGNLGIGGNPRAYDQTLAYHGL